MVQYIEENLSVSYGILKAINEEYQLFYHKCYATEGSSGSPIFNISNNKVIGIHKSLSIHYACSFGTFLNYPIKDFIKKYNL